MHVHQAIAQQNRRCSQGWSVACALAIGSLVITSGIGERTPAFAEDFRQSAYDSTESKNAPLVRQSIRPRALIGLLENEHRAVERQINNLETKLGMLVQEGDQRRGNDSRMRLDDLRQRSAELQRELTEAKALLGNATNVVPQSSGNLKRGRIDIALLGEDETSTPTVGLRKQSSHLLPSEVIDPIAVRRQIQEALIFLGGYDSIVDGDLGPRTEKAIRVFQERLGVQPTGHLAEWQVTELLNQAASLQQQYGLSQLIDDAVGYSLIYPSRLLPRADHIGSGYRALSSDSGAEYLYLVEADSRDFRTLFSDIVRHQVNGYSKFGDTWFVASGQVDDELFYSMGRRAGNRSIVAYLSYPESQRELWDPFTVLLYNSFHLTNSS